MIADYLEKKEMNDMHLLGFDLLDPNVKALKRGTVSYLIAQRPEMQGYRALRALADYLVFKTEVPMLNYMPMDILTDENIDFYLHFTSI
jgi:ABC-type sugar transport system, periplasmic component